MAFCCSDARCWQRSAATSRTALLRSTSLVFIRSCTRPLRRLASQLRCRHGFLMLWRWVFAALGLSSATRPRLAPALALCLCSTRHRPWSGSTALDLSGAHPLWRSVTEALGLFGTQPLQREVAMAFWCCGARSVRRLTSPAPHGHGLLLLWRLVPAAISIGFGRALQRSTSLALIRSGTRSLQCLASQAPQGHGLLLLWRWVSAALGHDLAHGTAALDHSGAHPLRRSVSPAFGLSATTSKHDTSLRLGLSSAWSL